MIQYSSGRHAKVRSYSGDRPSSDDPIDRPLTNPANPILAHYRQRSDRWPLDGYVQSVSPGNAWQWVDLASSEQIDHARAVLTRLAAFS